MSPLVSFRRLDKAVLLECGKRVRRIGSATLHEGSVISVYTYTTTGE